MSGIRGRGRRGYTAVPNWRWEDPNLSAHELRIAGWLASHADSYCEEYVTRNQIAKHTTVSQGAVSSAMVNLERMGIVKIETVAEPKRGGRRWIVWFDHARWEHGEGGQEMTTPGQEMTEGGQEMTTDTTYIEEHVEEQERTPQPPAQRTADAMIADAFDHWYSLYPRKVGKPKAVKAFKRAAKKLNGSGWDQLAAGTQAWCQFWREAHTDPQYIPHPATFLNDERWNDQPPSTEPRKSRSRATLDEFFGVPS